MITSAAVGARVEGKYVVLKVHRHCDFFETMKALNLTYDKMSVVQGFINWDGKVESLVSRKVAARIAAENNQILPSMKEEFNPDCLYSEDIY